MVVDYVDRNADWRLLELKNVILEEVVSLIIGTPLPSLVEDKDVLAWDDFLDGIFIILPSATSTLTMYMTRCTYTLGLGEPNLTAKPILRYDVGCTPAKIHLLVQDHDDNAPTRNYESKTVSATH
ncbi:hypothetical protein Fmac_001918 [Flemingia macrophylla]|uniref:Hs1pro-1 C-terminal domain-containing protein n=1 Tax=Flemingia macrophylla TaxID=520843 RepID=A0ABD1NJ96_9FABA